MFVFMIRVRICFIVVAFRTCGVCLKVWRKCGSALDGQGQGLLVLDRDRGDNAALHLLDGATHRTTHNEGAFDLGAG